MKIAALSDRLQLLQETITVIQHNLVTKSSILEADQGALNSSSESQLALLLIA